MINAYYTRPQTKPLRPTHHDNDTLQIWITSTSYVNYYRNIAYRLNGLKNLYESERLSRLGFRPPAIHQCAPESFVELEPDHDSDEESESDDLCYDDSHDEASDEDEKSSVATTHESLRSHPKVSRKCPRKATITSSTTSTTTSLTTAAEYTRNYQGDHGDYVTEGGVCLPDYESSENNSSASPYHLNVEISQNTEGGVSDGTLSGGSTPQVFNFAPTSPYTVLDNPGFSSPQF
ncbi:hypothetical protein BGZ79_002251 [Entomortierella chlamydospora]|nr:hypothetical protein BGZ79_002251 [Entomortierella chlamydospora]